MQNFHSYFLCKISKSDKKKVPKIDVKDEVHKGNNF